MMSIFIAPLTLTLVTHPLPVALMLLTLGGLVRHGIRSMVGDQAQDIGMTNVADPDVRAAA